MIAKLVNGVKTVLVLCFVLSSIVACEKDFENIGVNIVDNNLFNTSYKDYELIANTKNIEASRVDNLPRRILGVYKDDVFGKLEASYISQLGFPGEIDFGLDPVIDTVIIDIPYFAVQEEENNENNTPKFRIDSIYGDSEKTYQLSVYRLNTFLNTLDPENPENNKRYYSNESYEYGELLAKYDNFKYDNTDTVLYVKRPLLEEIDTIKKNPLAPSLKLSLDEQVIRDIFINNPTVSDLENQQNLNNYFRGIVIDAKENNEGGSIVTLNTNEAIVTIYYTNMILTDETETDLNGDGDLDDKQVPVPTKQSLVFPLRGVSTSIYSRNYIGSVVQSEFENPNDEKGKPKLYVQGAGGSIVEIELFRDEEIQNLRNKNRLINGAILDVYVKEGQSDIPNRLYLYNLDENSVIKDVISEAITTGIGGNISFDDDKPIKYSFLITDYISDVLSSGTNQKPLNKLALKTYHSTDLTLNQIDTIIRDFSWNPRGVTLYGSEIGEETTEDLKMKLRIYYTEDSNN